MKQRTVCKKHFQIKIGTFNLYKCPECGKGGIKETFNYCPYCATKLIFKENRELFDFDDVKCRMEGKNV
jgi:DNA-directed RNA polymerase subunit RPC12/RpoP